jgi:D-glycero-alpha-D-manno-heptose 1-phosphate guanylyltransferase
VPKPLAPVAGRPFLEWVLRYLRRQGVVDTVLSSGHLADQIEAFVGQLRLPGMRVISVPELEPLGTAGGFLNAMAATGNEARDAIVCNGDSLVLTTLAPLAATGSGADAALVGVRVADASRFGTLKEHGGWLKGFEEKRPGAGLINGGVYFFRGTTVARFPRKKPLSFEYDVFPTLLASNACIAVVPCEAPFLDIGTEETLAQADAFIRANMSWFE